MDNFGIYVTIGSFAEKAMATHSRTLAWKIPWMEESGRLQSMGLQRVRPDLVIKQQQQSAIHRHLDKEPMKTEEKLLLSNTNFPILRYYQDSCK